MTAKELIEKLSEVKPETEIVGGLWNGREDTYTVFDELHVFQYDQIYDDFYGTSSKEVVYIGSLFESYNKQVVNDRRVTWRMQRILRMHRSKEWKKEQIFKYLQEFAEDK